MKWVRKHVELGAQLALLALAVQFVLSFGHFHAISPQPAPAVQLSQAWADLAVPGGSVPLPSASKLAQKPQPPNQHNDHSPSDGCAICAVIAMANTVLFVTPPPLLLPQASELLRLTTGAGFEPLNSAPAAFNSRAPPLS
jgi:hypothetical protein